MVLTFQISIRGVHPKAPGNLQGTQEDRRSSGTERKLTDASLWGVDIGAATTRSASKLRISKAVRPVGRSISLYTSYMCQAQRGRILLAVLQSRDLPPADIGTV